MSGPKTAKRRRKKVNEAGSKSQECSMSDVCCDKIREAAYYKWEAAGCPCDDGVEFWVEAEAELAGSNLPSKPR